MLSTWIKNNKLNTINWVLSYFSAWIPLQTFGGTSSFSLNWIKFSPAPFLDLNACAPVQECAVLMVVTHPSVWLLSPTHPTPCGLQFPTPTRRSLPLVRNGARICAQASTRARSHRQRREGLGAFLKRVERTDHLCSFFMAI